MTMTEFWGLIVEGAANVQGIKALPEWIEQRLSARSLQDIADIEAWLAMHIDQANDELLWVAGSIVAGPLSNDGFLCFRCWLIAQGERAFQAAIRNPDFLAGLGYRDRGMFGPLVQLEEMLYVATRAANRKSGKPPFTRMELPPRYRSPPGCISCSTEIMNKGSLALAEDKGFLNSRFPDLMRRFSSTNE